ncbi:hypothetical protein [Blastococcus sp. SYSU DS0617]
MVVTVALLLLAGLPALGGLAGLWQGRGDPYLPIGDHALMALVVDAVGEHEVLLGAYSRFDWYHPGPMAAYLLAVPYNLLGEALQGLSAGALVINGVSVAVAVWLVRRRAGLVPAVWTLLVITLSVQIMGEGFLRDPWNPYLPVLPFLAGVLLCWTALRGDAWALPLAVVPLSLAAQSHVGFLPAVGAVGALLVAGLLLRAVRRRVAADAPRGSGQAVRQSRRWLVAGIVAVAVGALLWTPTVVQQLTGTPGNAGVLYDHLLRSSPEQTAGVSVGLRAVADEFGKVPAHLVGAGLTGAPLLPARWPAPAIAVGLALFAVALGVAAARRRGDVLWLGGLTLAVAAAGVVAVARIEGLAFTYLVQWTVVIGILAWTTVGLSLLPELEGGLRRVLGGRFPALPPGTVLGVPLAALTVVAVGVAAVGTARADAPTTDSTGEVAALADAVVADLDRRGPGPGEDPPVVRIDFAPTTTPVIVGTIHPGAGVALALHRAEVDVQVLDVWRIPFGSRFTDRADDAGYVATVAFADGTSPPPEPWQEVLAVRGGYQVYGGVPPTR